MSGPSAEETQRERTEKLVSMVDLKGLARSMLPSTSALKDLILSEPDLLASETAAVKVRMYSKLLHRELSSAGI